MMLLFRRSVFRSLLLIHDAAVQKVSPPILLLIHDAAVQKVSLPIITADS